MTDNYSKYIGQTFSRRYNITRIIGVGGMAVVFEGYDIMSDRPVAIKMLKEEIANDEQSVKRFISESKAVSMLSHKNIVAIYDVCIRTNPKYIVMELVEGITLKEYMRKRGALPLREVLNFSEQILRALSHAHSKNIIHRDIKPQNMMLLKDGTIKVADFGIAKLPHAETLTMTDKAIGTVYYISPEQAAGKRIDARSDLYSVGVMMYEMATGELPFVAPSPISVAMKQIKEPPQKPRLINPNIPIGLEQIILGAMEKDPDRRFSSADRMIRRIEQIKENPNYIFRARQPQQNMQNGQNINRTANNNVKTPTGQIKRPVNTSHGNTGSIKRADMGSVKTKKSSHSMLPIILGVTLSFLIVMIVSGVLVLNTILENQSKTSAKTITIENYVSQTFDAALEQAIKDTGYYKLTVTDKYSADYKEGEIISQEPSSGQKKKVIANKQMVELNLTVCRGVKKLNLPDFTILEYRAVEAEMREDYSLVPVTEKEYSDTVKAGYIIRTDPPAGTEVITGQTITLYVSKGQEVEYVTVPNFVGLTETKAYKLLQSSNLDYGTVTYVITGTDAYPDEVEKGKVISQSKDATSKAAVGTKINFVISDGIYGSPEDNEGNDE